MSEKTEQKFFKRVIGMLCERFEELPDKLDLDLVGNQGKEDVDKWRDSTVK